MHHIYSHIFYSLFAVHSHQKNASSWRARTESVWDSCVIPISGTLPGIRGELSTYFLEKQTDIRTPEKKISISHIHNENKMKFIPLLLS
jgi:hypothetical protein